MVIWTIQVWDWFMDYLENLTTKFRVDDTFRKFQVSQGLSSMAFHQNKTKLRYFSNQGIRYSFDPTVIFMPYLRALCFLVYGFVHLSVLLLLRPFFCQSCFRLKFLVEVVFIRLSKFWRDVLWYTNVWCPSICLSVCLSGINMSHRNLRMTYPNIMKLNIVVSYDGQMISILFGENKIKTFWVTALCN